MKSSIYLAFLSLSFFLSFFYSFFVDTNGDSNRIDNYDPSYVIMEMVASKPNYSMGNQQTCTAVVSCESFQLELISSSQYHWTAGE